MAAIDITVNVRVEDQFGNVLPADRHLTVTKGRLYSANAGQSRYQDEMRMAWQRLILSSTVAGCQHC